MLAAAAIFIVSLFPGQTARADDFQRNIMTGGPKGTYIQIGRDLARLTGECGMNLNVVESAGSLENLVGVKNKLYTQFGIVQSDVLDYVRVYASNDPKLKRSLWGVRIMFPLYNEEVHLLARRDIASLADLAGKRVAIGKKESGTWLTATLVLDLAKVKGAQTLDIASDEALSKLLSGEIDALFYVAGAPAPLFADPAIDGAKFHLVDIEEKPLLATYTAAEIPGGTYPFQPDPVSAIAVKAVLMTYDFDPSKSEYHAQSCKSAADIASLLLANLPRLRETGHPKWKTVDLADLPPGWQVSDCVKKGMAKDYPLQCGAPIAVAAQSESTKSEADQSEAAPASVVRKPADEEYLNLLKQRLEAN
jgi:TRAP transporter TAXI family solute receptor